MLGLVALSPGFALTTLPGVGAHRHDDLRAVRPLRVDGASGVVDSALVCRDFEVERRCTGRTVHCGSGRREPCGGRTFKGMIVTVFVAFMRLLTLGFEDIHLK